MSENKHVPTRPLTPEEKTRLQTRRGRMTFHEVFREAMETLLAIKTEGMVLRPMPGATDDQLDVAIQEFLGKIFAGPLLFDREGPKA